MFSKIFRASVDVFKMALCGLALFVSTGRPSSAQAKGYWHTQGNQILDENFHPLRIAGVSWYGFETRDGTPHGLTQQDYHSILGSIKSAGFNVVRLPYANEIVESPVLPTKIAFSNSSGKINQELRNLNSLQIMDRIVDAAGELGLHIILDNHRSDAGDGPQQTGLWYTQRYPESSWIADWQMLAHRYKARLTKSGDAIVIGADLRNEPHSVAGGGSCWTGDPARSGCPPSNTAQNWTSAAIRAGNAILFENSNLLIFVEGTDCYADDCTFWGSNLQGVRNSKVILTEPDRLVYSAHDYGPAEYRHAWFNASTTAASLADIWMKYWAFLVRDNTAPVWLGEFGTSSKPSDALDQTPGSQGQWFSSLIDFLTAHNSIHWSYWALNGEDRYGLLTRDYSHLIDPEAFRQQALARLLNSSN
jgi:endoglucanase